MGEIVKRQRSKEEIQELLKQKRELIKKYPEYYWPWPASQCNDYKRYKRFLENK